VTPAVLQRLGVVHHGQVSQVRLDPACSGLRQQGGGHADEDRCTGVGGRRFLTVCGREVIEHVLDLAIARFRVLTRPHSTFVDQLHDG